MKCFFSWIPSVLLALAVALTGPVQSNAQTRLKPVEPVNEAQLRRRFDQPLPGLQTPLDKDVRVTLSELTPAVILQSRADSATLLSDMAEYGLDGPTHMLLPVAGGRTVVKARGRADVELAEPWVLVWFAGGRGWDKIRHADYVQRSVKSKSTFAFDVPMLIRLQHKPRTLELGADGLKLTFAKQAGTIQIMPLLGTTRVNAKISSRWAHGRLPDWLPQRARTWSARLGWIPVQVEESYRVDLPAGRVELIHRFEHVRVKDDWNARAVKWSPVAPVIQLATEQGMDLSVAPKTAEIGVDTVFGPMGVVENTDTVTIQVNQVADLVGRVEMPKNDPDGPVRQELEKILAGKLGQTGMGWWAAASAAMTQGNKARLLGRIDDPDLAAKAKVDLMRIFHGYVFGGEKTTEQLVDADRGRVYLVDYVNHHQRYAGDNEAPASEILRGSFHYALHTGDWNTIRRHWDLLEAAGVASYVKNNWIIQSRPNSGGDTYHDVIVGTAAMARMAAVLGKAEECGFFTHLLARHLIAYHGFEYGMLAYARSVRRHPQFGDQPWFVPLHESKPMVVWDIYEPFGPFFNTVDAGGYYGGFSGFYEHYYRMDADVMPRFYHHHLKDWTDRLVERVVAGKIVPDPGQKEFSKWLAQVKFRADLGGWSQEKLTGWLAGKDFSGKGNSEVVMRIWDAKHRPELASIVHPKLRGPLAGQGLALQTNGLGHSILDLDVRSDQAGLLYWFGFNASGGRKPKAHKGNIMALGVNRFGSGQVIDATWQRPNWVAKTYSYNLSEPVAGGADVRATPGRLAIDPPRRSARKGASR